MSTPEKTGIGNAYTIAWDSPSRNGLRRESFSPDASYYDGPLQRTDRFRPKGPKFAQRSGARTATQNRGNRDVEKREDYLPPDEVVWDVDPVRECLHVIAKAYFTHDFQARPNPDAESASRLAGFVDWISVNILFTFFSHRDASRILPALAFCLVEEESAPGW